MRGPCKRCPRCLQRNRLTRWFCKRSPFLLLDGRKVMEKGWPLEKCAFRLLQFALHLCLFWWVIDSRELIEHLDLLKKHSYRQKCHAKHGVKNQKPDLKPIEKKYNSCRAWWVICWLIVLLGLVLLNPSCTPLKLLFLGIAALRLLEIGVTGIGTILAQEQQVGASNLTTIAVYFAHIVLIFAVFYHCVPGADFTVDLGPKHLPSAGSPGDYLYTSMAYVTSLEGNYKPKGGISEFLTVLTTTASIFLFTVLVAFGIDEVKKHKDDEHRVGEGASASK